MEKYSSGRRGAPAKGVDRESDAGVQIPPSPFLRFMHLQFKKEFEKNENLMLTALKQSANISNALAKKSGHSTLITEQQDAY